MDRIKRTCRRDHYPAYHKSGTRKLSTIRRVVLHDTEGGTASSIAAYFQSPASGGSTHLVVDDNQCQRCLPDSAIPWGAPGANLTGFHIEQCGFARWTKEQWLKHLPTIERAAYKTAYHCVKFDIPVVFLTAADLRKHKAGITTHAECTKAFGGSHTDPGAGWPRAKFMALVRKYVSEIKEG